jgi:uncharacterized protein (TIGR00159 family)
MYKLLRGTLAFNIFIGVVILYIIWWLVGILNMNLLSMLLGRIVAFGVIILVIIFQPEVREFLLVLGNTTLKGRLRFLERIFGQGENVLSVKNVNILRDFKTAFTELSKTKTGALIVFTREPVPAIENTGDIINGEISAVLIENIFFKNAPLHDGAMIIYGDKIRAARCILPVSKDKNLSKDLGLRHRAGIGVTENSNALSIIISEENGQISYASHGNLVRNISPEKAKDLISTFLYPQIEK